MPLPVRNWKAKRRDKCLLNQGYEFESSRVWYDADAEQTARDMYSANLESNRASNRWQQEKNSVAVRASKRESLARESRTLQM